MKHLISSLQKGSVIANITIGIATILFSFGQIGRLGLFELPIFGTVYEGFLGIGLFFLLFKTQFSKKVFKNELFIRGAIFFAWLAITLVISLFSYQIDQNILAVLYYFRLMFYALFFSLFLQYISKNKEVIPYYQLIIAISAVVTIVFSLVQYTLYPNIGNLAYQGWDPHLYRLVGLFFDPPVTASVFFLFAFYFVSTIKSKWLQILIAVSFLSLFFLTYSRGGFLALLITLVVYSIRKMKWKVLLAFIACAAVLYFVIPKNMSEGLNLTRTASIQTRIIDYNKAISIWKEHPFLGIGYNHIRAEKDMYEEEPIEEAYNPSHASASFHSSFLIILVTSGVVGLVLFGGVLLSLAKVSSFALYSLIFLSVYSLTDNVLLHPFILFLFCVLVGLSARHAELDSASPIDPGSSPG